MLLKIELAILKIISKDCGMNNFDARTLDKYPNSEIYQAFLSLQEKGYVEKVSASMAHISISYNLTIKGRYYKEYLFNSFLIHILIPFAVALITTMATLSLEKMIKDNNTSNATQNTSEYSEEY